MQKQDLLDTATKFGQIETFAVPEPADPDAAMGMAEDPVAAETSQLLKSSYLIHSYGAGVKVNPDNISPLRRSISAENGGNTLDPTDKSQDRKDINQIGQLQQPVFTEEDGNQRNRLLEYADEYANEAQKAKQEQQNRLLTEGNYYAPPQGVQEVPFMADKIPLSEQIRLYQRH